MLEITKQSTFACDGWTHEFASTPGYAGSLRPRVMDRAPQDS